MSQVQDGKAIFTGRIRPSATSGVRFLGLALALLALAALAGCAPSAEQDYAWGLSAYDEGNYDRARELWQPIAEQGHGPAQRNLGVMYYLGQGVEQDHDAALDWFRRAAEQGTGEVALKLAVMYAQGEGTEQDFVQAYKWVRVADRQGDPEAETWRAALVRRMTAEQIAEAQRQADAWQPAP